MARYSIEYIYCLVDIVNGKVLVNKCGTAEIPAVIPIYFGQNLQSIAQTTFGYCHIKLLSWRWTARHKCQGSGNNHRQY